MTTVSARRSIGGIGCRGGGNEATGSSRRRPLVHGILDSPGSSVFRRDGAAKSRPWRSRPGFCPCGIATLSASGAAAWARSTAPPTRCSGGPSRSRCSARRTPAITASGSASRARALAPASGRPNVVTIFDVGEWQGRPFIVAEYLAGGSVEDELRNGRVPLGQALAWLEQAALALDAAHAEGIVHRDVKPGNLLLDRDGNLHVADFGIASAAGMAAHAHRHGARDRLVPLTGAGAGERATPASDRYGLAVVAFELLAGERPFKGRHRGGRSGGARQRSRAGDQRAAARPAASSTTCSRARSRSARRSATRPRQSSSPPFATRSTRGERTQVLAAPPAATSRRPAWILPAVILLALLGGGLVLAALLVADDEPQARGETIVRTVTERGETRR